MTPVSKFILYSTILGIFSDALILSSTVDFRAFYLVILLNLFIMLVVKRLWMPTGLFILMTFLICSGAIGIFHGTDTTARFVKEFCGISITAIFFCSFFRTMDFDLRKCFGVYTRIAYWISVVGIFLYPFQYYFFHLNRLQSVLSEPAAFAAISLPAVYYFADRWIRSRSCGKETSVMLFAFLLSQSSVGFIGLFFGVCVLFMRYRRVRFIVPAVLTICGFLLYSVSGDFAKRLDDSFFSLENTDVSGTNISTFAIFSNLFVMENVISAHPLVGNGLGSHGMSYHRYIGDLPGKDEFVEAGLEGLNAEDANSFLVRVLSDMGLVGATMVFSFLWIYRPRGDTDLSSISKAITVYFFVTLLRGGNYFSYEHLFFIILYALCGVQDKCERSLLKPSVEGPKRRILLGQHAPLRTDSE